MTATRKEFEEWFLSQYGVNFKYAEFQFDHAPETNFAWQACQSLNDKRIQQLLSLIAKKDEALQEITTLHGSTTNFGVARYIATNALSIKPENVELVEVGLIKEEKMADWMKNTELSVECKYNAFNAGDKLYTIKHK